jgi:hypothetical protein
MNSGVNTAKSLINWHKDFLLRNKGTTNNPKTDNFVFNQELVLSNNRHFIADTHQEYQPNGDSTTEGQSLMIMAFAYAYLATHDQSYLTMAEEAFDAYLLFYANDPIPSTPQRWISNWLINGKEPCLAHYPLNQADPTCGGYKGVPLLFVNGQAQIPHGAPYWGEYLDVATFAYRGALAWDAINATPKPFIETIDWASVYTNRINTSVSEPHKQNVWVDWASVIGSEPTIDWSGATTPEYQIEWINCWTLKKIGILRGDDDQLWSGSILGDVLASEVGTIQLTDTSVNGVYMVNYASRLPVALGGYEFARNEVWHNRPIHTPLGTNPELRGNAADGEVWFADACKLMFDITGNQRYYDAWKSCEFTALEYVEIDRTDKFFRKSKNATTPFTEGISYDFTYYPNPGGDRSTVYGRDVDGNITIRKEQECKHSMEQQAIPYRVNLSSSIRTSWGGVDDLGGSLGMEIQLGVSEAKEGMPEVLYGATLANSTSTAVATVDTLMTNFVRLADDFGNDYLVAKMSAVTDYGGCVPSSVYESNVYDGRDASIVNAFFPDDNAGFIIGAWLTVSGRFTPTSIIYRATHDFNLRIEDDDLWRWWWMLPATAGAWVEISLPISSATLSGYQPDHVGETVFPASPVISNGVTQFQILMDSVGTNANFSYYAVNTPPPRFNSPDWFVTTYRATFIGETAFTAKLGDCTVINSSNSDLFCVPGVIPFSNIYVSGSEQFGAWHGMPYPGYQYPWLFLNATTGVSSPETMLANSIQFLYDSQRWYTATFNNPGPGASAYVWNRWDTVGYGTPDTWTMYHWGDGHAWDGYQPRAFFAGARALYELVKQGRPVPIKLYLYVETWIKWLIKFIEIPTVSLSTGTMYPDERATPTSFPSTSSAQPIHDDFTGHMCGLWLAGSSLAKSAGMEVPGLDRFMDFCVDELAKNYVVTGTPGSAMDGSWSPWAGGGMFFGFWAGEIMRGLSLYTFAKTQNKMQIVYEQPTSTAPLFDLQFSGGSLTDSGVYGLPHTSTGSSLTFNANGAPDGGGYIFNTNGVQNNDVYVNYTVTPSMKSVLKHLTGITLDVDMYVDSDMPIYGGQILGMMNDIPTPYTSGATSGYVVIYKIGTEMRLSSQIWGPAVDFPIPTDEWFKMSIVSEDVGGAVEVRCYINDVLVNSVAQNGVAFYVNFNNVTLFQYSSAMGGGNGSLQGGFHGVKIYPYAKYGSKFIQ